MTRPLVEALRLALPLLVVALGCSGGRSGPRAGAGVPPGAIARVGDKTVTLDAVVRVAQAQHLTVPSAADLVIRDTLLAREAEARGLATTSGAKLAWETELARRVLRQILADARSTPPTAEELQSAAARRWLDVDRPEGFRTVHAVAKFTATDPPEKKARARAVAELIRRRVEAATIGLGGPRGPRDLPTGPRIGPESDPDPLSAAFRAAAGDVHEDGVEITVEPLPPVSASGRVLEPGGGALVPEYSQAAARLVRRGDISPVVESSFGAHVILLLERTPSRVLEGPALTAKLRDDIVNERARLVQKRLLAEHRKEAEIAADVVGLLSLPRVEE